MQQAPLLTVEQAKQFLNIGQTSLYEAMGTGALRYKKFGRKTLFLRTDLIAFANALPDGPAWADKS